ncbi:hypothetical protein EUGRSUZ_G01946 [Eucalyptus grandis]|uniref:Uncharacterized protein n=2 Tax=Eucalyptus grandis TaxID=71139 RepID=A0ACC3K4L9_EUCGR|nr:hypothetical protein EUGRSUZ_G01946 [Eucalyptus grandis]
MSGIHLSHLPNSDLLELTILLIEMSHLCGRTGLEPFIINKKTKRHNCICLCFQSSTWNPLFRFNLNYS